ncbi:MAG: type II secretion system F family protein, partial [Candidatus Hydrogenedentes bacterium]|nr:type II secretion system F family protein [Candidatus Hydrogenedentota bacterium]
MTEYTYRAVDSGGNPVEGTMEESSAHRVTRKLQERGLTVTAVEELHQERGILRLSQRLTWEELNLVTDQLAAITRSNLPLAPALKALAADLRNPRLKPLLDRLHQELERGATLEQALLKNHQSFPRLYVSMVRAGEQTGNLAAILQIMTSYTTRMASLKQNLAAVLTYPIMVLLLGMAILSFLMVKVVPVFAEIFQEFGAQLPAPTRFWIDASDFVVWNFTRLWLTFFGVLAFLYVVRAFLRRSANGRCWLERFSLMIPVAGRFHYLLSLVRFTRTLGVLLASRVPVLESLELAGAASGSPILHRATEEAVLQVASGERLSDALSSTGFFGHTFCWLLSTGEQRGEVEQALEGLADSYEREANLYDRTWGTLFAPLVI